MPFKSTREKLMQVPGTENEYVLANRCCYDISRYGRLPGFEFVGVPKDVDDQYAWQAWGFFP